MASCSEETSLLILNDIMIKAVSSCLYTEESPGTAFFFKFYLIIYCFTTEAIASFIGNFLQSDLSGSLLP